MTSPLINVSLLQLRAFLAVSQHGSFTLAAEALHRTQPAVTIQVRQLEQALGLKLLDRSTRRLSLTAVGRDLVPVLTSLLQQLDGIVASSQEIRTKRAGIVRIACLPSMAANFLPEHIAVFRRMHPGVTFLLNDGLGDRITDLVKSGKVEFGITDQMASQEFDVQPLLEERMCVLFLEGHPLQHVKAVTIDELARHDLILMAQGSNARRIVDNAFAASGRAVVPACEASYMTTAVGMVQAGLGVTVLPRGGIALQLDTRLRCREIDVPGFIRRIAVVRLKHRTMSPAAQSFLQMLGIENLPPVLQD